MTVIMATVGFTPSKVHPVLDREDHKEELVLFYDKDSPDNKGRSKQAARELVEHARKLGVDCKSIEINAFDLVESCLKIRAEIRKRAGKDIVVCISGGTRVLSSAALLASILEGVRVVHVRERDNEVESLPMLQLKSTEVLGAKQRRVLQHIRDHPGCLQRDIGKALGLTKGTVSHHIQRLKRQGLVEAQSDSEDARSEKLMAVPSADLLLVE